MAVKRNIVVVSVRDWLRVEADLGPLVPINALCRLVGKSKQSVWGRIQRGSVPVVRVSGQAFVPVDYWSTSRVGDQGLEKE